MNDLNILKIAQLIVLSCHNRGLSISPLKLQKLLFYTQAWYMVYFEGDTLFSEVPQAWVNGPVYKDVYTHYQHNEKIGVYDTIPFDGELDELPVKMKQISEELNLSEKDSRFIEKIVETYGVFDHNKLVYMTHCEDPWVDARGGFLPFEKCDNNIPLDVIKEYYGKRLKKSNG